MDIEKLQKLISDARSLSDDELRLFYQAVREEKRTRYAETKRIKEILSTR